MGWENCLERGKASPELGRQKHPGHRTRVLTLSYVPLVTEYIL